MIENIEMYFSFLFLIELSFEHRRINKHLRDMYTFQAHNEYTGTESAFIKRKKYIYIYKEREQNIKFNIYIIYIYVLYMNS